VQRSIFFGDRQESVLAESGDFLIPLAEGAIEDNHFQGELGDVLVGKVAGRQDGNQITLFKSLGLALEDLAAARLALRIAKEKGLGTVLPWTV
jgi:alanine dehydrogenase